MKILKLFFKSNRPSLRQEIQTMTTTLAQLDTAVQALTTATQKLVADLQPLLTKLADSPDFTAEAAAVQASIDALNAADTTVQAALNPPAEAPAETETIPVPVPENPPTDAEVTPDNSTPTD